ncbi:MAG: hypothetical protein AAF889_07695 [Cyanobacteria bacterium P01_D01_bin.73]
MAQPNEKSLEQRLQEIEAELNRGNNDSVASPKVTVESPRSPDSEGSTSLIAAASSLLSWFSGLGTTGKIIAGVVGAFAALTLLRITVTLVSTVVSLVALGLVGYVAYRIWVAPKTDDI